MRSDRPLLLVLGIILLFLIFFAPRSGLWLQRLVSGTQPLSTSGTSTDFLALQSSLLTCETALGSVKGVPRVVSGGVQAFVYSRYPFNFKNELTIDAGSRAGIRLGDPVLYRGMLLGKVEAVDAESATVMTIFDTRFQIPARVGSGVDTLLKGGNAPILTLIPKDAQVSEGAPVISAASGMPYGLLIGKATAFRLASDHVFGEADIAFPYNPNDIQSVVVVPAGSGT